MNSWKNWYLQTYDGKHFFVDNYQHDECNTKTTIKARSFKEATKLYKQRIKLYGNV